MKKFVLFVLFGLFVLSYNDAKAVAAKIWRYHSGEPGIWVALGGNGSGGTDFWCVGYGNVCDKWDWMTMGMTLPPDDYVDEAMPIAAVALQITLPPLPVPDIETYTY
ncbi:MAG: hypothetical protein JST20_11215 [Bacteroidetes bacterium]|nr:hypothetical protein [Bacteroidota bacterium]